MPYRVRVTDPHVRAFYQVVPFRQKKSAQSYIKKMKKQYPKEGYHYRIVKTKKKFSLI